MSTHHRAGAFLDAYADVDTTIVDVTDGQVGEHRRVVINFAGKSWSFDFAHHADHDFVDVHLFDDTPDVQQFHRGTADEEWNPKGPSTPIGVFGMCQGLRRALDDPDSEFPTNHGWPAAATITLLADSVTKD